MIAIGFDPGVTLGWAVLRDGVRGRAVFLAGGSDRTPSHAFLSVVVCGGGNAEAIAAGARLEGKPIVCIETVEGYAHEHARSAALHATAHMAGTIEGIAYGLGREVIHAPAVEWRKQIIGRRTASDDMVKNALRVLVADLPDRTNVHMRDAIGAALYGLRVMQARRAGRAVGARLYQANIGQAVCE